VEFLESGPECAPYELRALTAVAHAATSGLGQPQRAMIDAVQRLVLHTDLDVESLAPIEPAELAAHIEGPGHARQLVRLMVATSLADGPPSQEQISQISAHADALHIEEPSLRVVTHLAKGHRLRFRFAFMRRSHIRAYIRNTYRMLGGIRPMVRALLVARGVIGEDRGVVARYRALAELPEGTLGREFYRHYTKEGLAFPGEKSGFPVGALFHDFSHVLAGYDTSPEGEMKNAAFQAGFTRHNDAFFTALFAIVIHTAGINLAPFPMPVLRGRIGQGTLAWDVLHGLQRGAAMKLDLGDGWDFWEYVELPMEQARARLGIPPVRTAPAAA
jgi:hypothetical protein